LFSPFFRFVPRRASAGSTLGRRLVIALIAFLHNHMVAVGASKLVSGSMQRTKLVCLVERRESNTEENLGLFILIQMQMLPLREAKN